MSFIFISYSRQDQAYVSTLVQALQSHRLPVWIDDRIDYGTTWPRVIQDHLEQCAVFVVVMSPRSEDSHWVQCELSLALELKKPIFPLLLEGRRWLSVAAIQSVDVLGGQLPPARFFDTVRGYFPTATVAESLPV
ncbi:toll/interleukin-1 receptor domain-containing protein [Leptolyngbya iicbica]|uniref:Toll/interleukin-1 receptor domain-containing protein n=2 Tax=Cyanophyceae TaxID=3028117 RepID=A0A4Q7E8X7_9CYAN|nr:toll/interleukin-1 receptor domain-containing protein [Leptolyngbya sp. LK]RZM78829.1 toll/interleukin-1 receptor domain-containing protein [Leptolyngbya sp. LK]